MVINFRRPVITNRQTTCFDVVLSRLSSKGTCEQMVSPSNVIKIVFKHLCPSLIYHPLVYKCSDQLVSASHATHFNTICNIMMWGELSSEYGGEIFVGRVVLERDFHGASCLGATCLVSARNKSTDHMCMPVCCRSFSCFRKSSIPIHSDYLTICAYES